MLRKILIVEDEAVNRKLLTNILCTEYDVLEAVNGAEALSLLQKKYKIISAVVLDLMMPVMDGFTLLTRMRSNASLSQIPVIVATGSSEQIMEVRALSLGANDFITKPYNPALILHCLRNTINLRETASIVNAIQRDKLTGLLNREAFFDKVGALIQDHEPGYYVLSCFDIDNFKVINDQYGAEQGDRILRHIGRIVKEDILAINGIVCRISADNFAALYPASELSKGTSFLQRMRKGQLTPADFRAPIVFSIGRYVVTDLSLSASGIYDRAYIAKQSVKGRYDKHIALFDETMRERLLMEQEITSEMDLALARRQFEVWFQPQFNHASGALIGAESLVRWRHPEKGLIQPGDFIPVFEQNGFIYELDKFVWAETCRFLRKWLDEGRKPLPVSVNISRYDVFRADLIDVITDIVHKYDVPVELLRLEITESAFSRSAEQIIDIVKRLIDYGFTLEIDDFGSGYSSLNTLKDVPAQVLKLDMRFLENDGGSERGGNILESIVRMTKWLGMSVIAEGVETIEQADYLKSIGCNYVQGYLYSRPVPASDYEALAKEVGKEERLLTLETVETLDRNAFWNPRSMDTLIFNCYVGGACIFEWHGDRIEIIRANDKYAKCIGGEHCTTEYALSMVWEDHMDEEASRRTRDAIQRAIDTGDDAMFEAAYHGLPGSAGLTYLRTTFRLIARTSDRYLFYASNENITLQRVAEEKERRSFEQMQTILDNVGSGITATVITNGHPRFLLANDRYFAIHGFTRAEYEAAPPDIYTIIHPDDCARVRAASTAVVETGRPAQVEYRIRRRDGEERFLRASLSATRFAGVAEPVQLCILTDTTERKRTEQEVLDNLPCGAALYELDGKDFSAIYLNRRYRELVGRELPDPSAVSVLGPIHPDDRASMIREVLLAIQEHRDARCFLRILYGADEYRLFQVAGRIIPNGEGKYAIYAAYTRVEDESRSYQEMLPIALSTVMSSSSDLSFVKDRSLRYICCSRTFAESLALSDEKDLIGKTDYELIDADYADRFHTVDLSILESGQARLDYDEMLPTSDGTTRYASTSKYPLLDSTGNVIGVYGVTRDTTQYHNLYDQLKLVTDNIPGGIATYTCTQDSIRITYFNDGFCALFGYSREEYAKKSAVSPMSLVFDEDRRVLLSQLERLLRDGTPIECVYRVHTASGGYKWINHKAVIVERREGSAVVNAMLFDVTAQHEASERLRVSEEQFRIAAALGDRTVARYDIKNRIYHNDSDLLFLQGFAREIPNAPDCFVEKGIVAQESIKEFLGFYRSIQNGARKASTTAQLRVPGGEFRWFRLDATTIFGADKQPSEAILVFYDVTEQREKETVYKRWQQSMRNRPLDSYTIFRCNLSRGPALDSVEGTLLNVQFGSEAQTFDARTREYVENYVYPDDRAAYLAALSSDTLLANYYRGKRSDALEYRELVSNSSVRWLRRTVELIESPDSTDVLAYLMYEDIDDSKRAEIQTRELAETDPLTGVLNRNTFAERMGELLQKRRNDTLTALLMFDIDGFKLVNDSYGHAVGDQALVEIADSLRAIVRQEDLVGRLGGDEFLICLHCVPNRAVVAKKAKQILAAVRKSFSIEVQMSASLGVAVCPQDGASFDTLYRKADVALYHVKATGKDNYAFFTEAMHGENPRPENLSDVIVPMPAAHSALKRRMLIVEDDRPSRDMLVSIFRDEFLIDTADNGNAALIRLRRYGAGISIVLLDLLMPGMDGFAVLEKMRASSEMQSIPVIVVSGVDERETSLRTIRCGASDYVTKPVDAELLRIRVQSAISKAENERLRAQNSYLALQREEVSRYRAALESDGVVMVEYDAELESFTYDRAIAHDIDGRFDDRPLWLILSEDRVASSADILRMRALVDAMAKDLSRITAGLTVSLRTPTGAKRRFRMKVIRRTDGSQLGNRLLLTFTPSTRHAE